MHSAGPGVDKRPAGSFRHAAVDCGRRSNFVFFLGDALAKGSLLRGKPNLVCCLVLLQDNSLVGVKPASSFTRSPLWYVCVAKASSCFVGPSLLDRDPLVVYNWRTGVCLFFDPFLSFSRLPCPRRQQGAFLYEFKLEIQQQRDRPRNQKPVDERAVALAPFSERLRLLRVVRSNLRMFTDALLGTTSQLISALALLATSPFRRYDFPFFLFTLFSEPVRLRTSTLWGRNS